MSTTSIALRVLVVDDNPVHRTIYFHMLSRMGYEIEMATNGIEALDLLQGDGVFHVVILDVAMPEMDGWDTLRAIRAMEEQGQRSHLPVIMITAHGNKEDRNTLLHAGADDFLPKPVIAEDLRQKLETILQRE